MNDQTRDPRIVEAELRKLELEARAIEKRLSTRWYSGRILIESLVAGVVAGSLIVGWILGVYLPMRDQSKETAALRETNQQLERRIEAAREATKLREYERSIRAFHQVMGDLRDWSVSMASRLEAMSAEAAKRANRNQSVSVSYLETMSRRLSAEVDAGKNLAQMLGNADTSSEAALQRIHQRLDALTNHEFHVRIVYGQHHLHDLANQIAEKVGEDGFNVAVDSWSRFKEHGDAAMGAYMTGGWMLWYSPKDASTVAKSARVLEILAGIIPDSLVRKETDLLKGPGVASWSISKQAFQVWLN